MAALKGIVVVTGMCAQREKGAPLRWVSSPTEIRKASFFLLPGPWPMADQQPAQPQAPAGGKVSGDGCQASIGLASQFA